MTKTSKLICAPSWFSVLPALACLLAAPAWADGLTAVSVFQNGKDGYKIFRIPAVIRAANGDILAFCEARAGGDASEIDLVLKSSSDGGKTWRSLEVVQESDDFRGLLSNANTQITIGNPAPVVDLLDPKHPGRIWLPYTLENDRVFVAYSDDHGKTWSKRREITSDVKKKNWGWYATGPVHSIQIQRGPHKGRLVIPCDHRIGEDGHDRGALGAHVVLSDDHGKTWRLGAIDDTYKDDLNANETTVVELGDGRLYFNTRDQRGEAKGTRGGAYSSDGGESFDRSPDDRYRYFRPSSNHLDPPVVQCSLLRAASADGDKGNLILFSGPDENGPTGKGRSDLRIRYTTDETATWRDGPLIHVGPAAYSDMILLGPGEYGVLFEAGKKGVSKPNEIVFARLTDVDLKESDQASDRESDQASAAKRPGVPNILLIVSEDNGPELGCYGDPYVQTPVLNNLAEEGVRFHNAYVPQAGCSQSRAALLTGRYPHQNGQIGLATWKFRMYSEDTPNIVRSLKRVGYRTGILGKLHINPATSFPFDMKMVSSSNFGRKNLSDYVKHAESFFAAGDKPFFLSVNYPDAHRPLINQVKGLPAHPLTGDDVKPLAYFGLDTPELREQTASYYNCMSRLDSLIGDLLDALRRSGKADNTLIVYLGDHGADLLRGKRTSYEGGVRVPLIVRWPPTAKSKHVCDELVSTLDLMPTLLAVAKAEPVANLPGRSLLPLLRDEETTWREYLYTEFHLHSAHNFYPQRTIRNDRYKLIQNLLPGQTNPGYDFTLKRFFANLPKTIEASPDHVRAAYHRMKTPPEFELYDLKSDPYEFHNLASNGNHAKTLFELKQQIAKWRRQTNDPLLNSDNLERLKAEVDACIVNGNANKSRLNLTYPEYFFATSSSAAKTNSNDK